MSDWLNRYNARRSGQPRPVAPPPPQQYQPPPQQYQQPPPLAYPQPVPGAPAHAPFGYDPATGVPVAPYGHDQYGRIVTQPLYAPPPQQVPQQPGYQPNGLPAPNGYGQPPYGPVQPVYDQPPPPADGTPQGFHDRVRYAISHVQGNTAGNREVGVCMQCGGPMVPTDATGFGVPDGMPQSAGVFNVNTGQTVYPAAHCATCGHINSIGRGQFAPGGGTAAMGVGVKVVGAPRLAPGAGSMEQVAHQHGMPNLFAPK
jgi:hypothetical protein